MATYRIPEADGVYTSEDIAGQERMQILGLQNRSINHQMNFVADSATEGSVLVEGKAPGSNTWEQAPGNPVDLSDIQGIVMQYLFREYRFTVSGSNGTGFITAKDSRFMV